METIWGNLGKTCSTEQSEQELSIYFKDGIKNPVT